MRSSLAKYFGIDPRSLALLRIALGAILLVDLSIRATDLVAHYTDAGAVLGPLVREHFSESWRWSLHLVNGSAAYQGVLFSIAAVAAGCMLLGYRTRAATIVSWVLLASLHTRNPFVLNAGDTMLRMLVMWSMFLPLGACWSFDNRRRKRMDKDDAVAPSRPVVSLACAAILLQVCIIYWATAYFKVNDYWQSGDALHYVFSFDAYARPLASKLLDYPQLLTWLSRTTLVWEFAGPLLLFVPWRTSTVRMFVIAGFVLLHVGIELTLTVGLFSYVSLAAWTVFIPGSAWDVLGRKFGREVATQEQAMDAPSQPGFAPDTRWPGLLSNLIVAILLLLVVTWNIFTLDFVSQWYGPPNVVRRAAQLTGTIQKWSMFNEPPRRDGWFVAIARLTDGEIVDLGRDGQAVDWDTWRKPSRVIDRSKNHRWRKFSQHFLRRRYRRLRPAYCEYLHAEWRRDHPDAADAASIEIFYMQEATPPPDDDLLYGDLPTGDDTTVALEEGKQPTFTQRRVHRHELKPLPLPDYLQPREGKLPTE